MRVSTGKGDGGKTTIAGDVVSKDSAIIAFVGALDELISWLGLCKDIHNKPIFDELQDITYTILSSLHKKVGLQQTLLARLEELSQRDISLTSFIKPTGRASYLHIARTVARRAEREAVRASVNKDIIKALNRISDIIFIEAYNLQKEDGSLSYFKEE
ncbi:MAG: ATP:cob(I)alamin adenosyltransferase [Methanobacteriota archaeon]|nr:MAG: ATP:cob(I)alamin adenosyltransferase [Euryarchaeota archaeon]